MTGSGNNGGEYYSNITAIRYHQQVHSVDQFKGFSCRFSPFSAPYYECDFCSYLSAAYFDVWYALSWALSPSKFFGLYLGDFVFGSAAYEFTQL